MEREKGFEPKVKWVGNPMQDAPLPSNPTNRLSFPFPPRPVPFRLVEPHSALEGLMWGT
jgi:hypothetical protein